MSSTAEDTDESAKRFDYTDELLKKTYEKYLDGNYRVAGISLIVIGWLITSDSAQETLKSDEFIWWIAAVMVTGGIVNYLVTFLRLYFLSRQLTGELVILKPALADKIQLNGIRPQLAIAATVVNLALFSIVLALLVRMS